MTPVHKPTVDTKFTQMNGLQRAAESFRHGLLSLEFWISPHGLLRDWFRRNVLVSIYLVVPAVLVMPVVGLILWQLTGWLAMLTSIAAKLIVLPVRILLAFVFIKIVVAFLKR